MVFSPPCKAIDYRFELRPWPTELRPFLADLSRVADTFVSAHPNVFTNQFGEYDLDAVEMAEIVAEYAKAGLVNIIGGCCGTTPEHIRLIANNVTTQNQGPPTPRPVMRLSGLEPFIADDDDQNVGEWTTVTVLRCSND